MPYIVDVTRGQGSSSLPQYTPSFGSSLGTAFGSTLAENPTSLIWDAGMLRQANAIDKPRLDRTAAEARVKESGFKIAIPEDGYTQEALDILIERQRNRAAIESIQSRTPWSWLGSPIRGGASLLAGVVDPLNVASAFVPVVREQRMASMLARAGGGSVARAGVRAQVGAVEGVAGAAMLEPLVYGMHSQLQDDYDMSDSLVNLGFGGILGGGLHVGVGTVADVWRPKKAVTAADVPDILPARADVPPESAVALIRGTSPEVREVALRSAVADMAQGKVPEVQALIDVWHGSPHQFDRFDSSKIGTGEGAQAFGHGLYLAESAGVAKSYAENLSRTFDAVGDVGKHWRANGGEAAFREFAAGAGLDQRQIAETVAAINNTGNLYRVEMPKAMVDRMLNWDKPLSQQSPEAQRVLNDWRADKHESLADFFERVQRSDSAAAELLAIDLRQAGIPGIKYLDQDSRAAGEGSHNFVIFPGGEGALSIADRNGERIQAAREAAARQQTAISAVADPEASRAADERLKAAPKDNGVESAQAELDAALSRLGIVEETKAEDPVAKASAAAQEALTAQKASGVPIDQWLHSAGLEPEVHNLVVGLSEAPSAAERTALLADFERSWIANPTMAADDIAADVVEAARSGRRLTPESKKEVEAAKGEMFAADVRLAQAQSRLQAMGVDAEQAAKMTEGLKAFDEGIQDAKNIGAAIKALAGCENMS